LSLVALLAALAGLGLGAERLAALDSQALHAPPGRRARVSGFVTAVPRRSDGDVQVRVQTADGRLAVEAPEPVPELAVGREIAAEGVLRDPPRWQQGYLRRFGIAEILAARRIELTGRRRGGVVALTDRVRDRAEAALDRGMPEPEAALARGFVLGEDDRIDPRTVTDFKRSGLAHVLAVSGQNVLLLALLATPLLAALGLRLRARLLCVLALIAVYVPVTGAAPSIQRAGVMGAAGVVAALAGRPRSRWYAVLLAAFATLALNPRASADVGWQLSFVAVAGILLWAAPIRDALLGARRESAPPSQLRRTLAEGAALTIAATLATAPLMAHHFESVSVAALPANLAALPAIAPVMWLGMASAIAGQVPALPVEPLNELNALLIAYVAQVAHWMATPSWALLPVHLEDVEAVAAAYALLLLGGWSAGTWLKRRRALVPRSGEARSRPRTTLAAIALLIAAAALLILGTRPALPGSPAAEAGPARGLEVTVLDVGQGDSILLEPADGAPVLVDSGPPDAELESQLDDEGVERLAALAITHDQLDHSGGAAGVLSSFDVGSLLYAEAGRGLLGAARAAGARTTRVAEGRTIRSGSLRLDVLSPPPVLLEGRPTADEQNRLSLVMLARWHGFSILLTGDAEAVEAPVDPGPLDVLKLAHHGSEDAGLDRLLDTTVPRLAVISVGQNSYGHPTPQTLSTLAEHRVPVLRTDRDGDVEIDVTASGWTVATG
jgi:competence protein ComEC